jgi:hypothetical protein
VVATVRHYVTANRILGIATLRLVIGLALLPLFNFALAFLTFPLIWYSEPTLSESPAPWDWTDPALSWASGVVIASLFLTVCGAATLIMVLLWRGHASLQDALVAGILLANAAAVLFGLGVVVAKIAYGLPFPGVGSALAALPVVLRALTITSLMGGASGLFFWLVGIWKGPFDRNYATSEIPGRSTS